ncbi:Uncharacterised protein [Mycobacteroides abscessus subsp. bolletii]|nr:Uncharacterised protein [Mycobacteroides abscessus subsp. bolletii]SIJ69169.1 Uncharacterised protein [Mycobacteroides abscessus subsp. bolletii]SKT28307.1 Uncharacterised protein [Mycobacteroides abscessus subsp. bolletii]SKT32976.1 Uncharacterised protein [Mycobacteroides abscessus subsp. bolletii]SLD66176.1 Uncharacterised protein [Mycobacteroides abscessus subsp. bolletii]
MRWVHRSHCTTLNVAADDGLYPVRSFSNITLYFGGPDSDNAPPRLYKLHVHVTVAIHVSPDFLLPEIRISVFKLAFKRIEPAKSPAVAMPPVTIDKTGNMSGPEDNIRLADQTRLDSIAHSTTMELTSKHQLWSSSRVLNSGHNTCSDLRVSRHN